MSTGSPPATTNSTNRVHPSPTPGPAANSPPGGSVSKKVEPYTSNGDTGNNNDNKSPAASPSRSSPPAAKKQALGYRMISALGFTDHGVFRMADALFGWKRDDAKTNSRNCPQKVIRQSSEINQVMWAPVSAKDCALIFKMKDESILTFVGFKDNDLTAVQRYTRHHWKIEVEITKMATRGWHWGHYDFIGDSMRISINNDPAIYFHAKSLKQITNNPGKAKNELLLGFDEEESVVVNQDLVYEVKLHVVPEEKLPEDEDEKEEGTSETKASHLEYLYDSLLAKSNLTSATASNVAFILEYMNLASPPGRFDIHVVRDGFKLYGKSGNFGPIPWTSVEAIYHLETKPSSHLLLELASSLRKGQTSYKHIVIQLEDRKQREISLNLAADGPTDKKLIDEYKLTPLIKSEEKKVVPKLLAVYGNKKPVRSIAKDPTSDDPKPMPAIECSYKQQLGKLSFMQHCVIFAPKPPTIIKIDEINLVDFRSPSTRTRLFTFRIMMKASRTGAGGSVQPVEHHLESIDRSEYDVIYKYFIDRGVKTRTGTMNEEGGEAPNEKQDLNLNQLGPEDSEDDEDFEDKGASDSDDHGMSDLEPDEDDDERSSPASAVRGSGGGPQQSGGPTNTSGSGGSKVSRPSSSAAGVVEAAATTGGSSSSGGGNVQSNSNTESSDGPEGTKPLKREDKP